MNEFLTILALVAITMLPFWLGWLVAGGRAGGSAFEGELGRIEAKVRRARREVDRLEAEAMRAIRNEAVRRQIRP